MTVPFTRKQVDDLINDDDSGHTLMLQYSTSELYDNEQPQSSSNSRTKWTTSTFRCDHGSTEPAKHRDCNRQDKDQNGFLQPLATDSQRQRSVNSDVKKSYVDQEVERVALAHDRWNPIVAGRLCCRDRWGESFATNRLS